MQSLEMNQTDENITVDPFVIPLSEEESEESFFWHGDTGAYVYAAFFSLLWIVGMAGNVRNLIKNCCKQETKRTTLNITDFIFLLGKIMSLFNILLFAVRTFTTLNTFLSPLAFGKLVCLVHFISNFHIVFGLHFTTFFIAKESYNILAKKDAYLGHPKRLQILLHSVVMWVFVSLIVFGGFMMGVKKPCIIPSELSFAFSCYTVSISTASLVLGSLTYIKVRRLGLLDTTPTIAHIVLQSTKVSLLYFVCWSPLLGVVLYNNFCLSFGYSSLAFTKMLSIPPRILLNVITAATLVSSAAYPFVCKLESLRAELNRIQEINLNPLNPR